MSGKVGSVDIFSLGAAGAQTGAARAAAATATQQTAASAAIGHLVFSKKSLGKGAKQDVVIPSATQKLSLLFQRLNWNRQSATLRFLPYPDFLRCQTVCRDWRIQIAQDPLIWRAFHTSLHRAAFVVAPAEITSISLLREHTDKLFRLQVHLRHSVYTTRAIAFPGLDENFFRDNVTYRVLTPLHNHLLALNDGSIQVWKLVSGKMERIASFQAYTAKEGRPEFAYTYFTSDGTLVTKTIDQVYKTWTSEKNETVWKLKAAYPVVPRGESYLNSQGRLLNSNNASTKVTVSRCVNNAWQVEGNFDTGAHPRQCSFTPEELILTTHLSQEHNEPESTQIWGKVAQKWKRFEAIPSFATCHIYTSDLKLLIGKRSGKVEIWNRTTWQLEATIPANNHPITALEYQPNRIVATTIKGVITVWDQIAGEWVLQTYINKEMLSNENGIQSAYTLPDGNILVYGSSGKTILCDFGASPIAALAEISRSDQGNHAIRRFFSLPSSVKSEVYRKLLESQSNEAAFSRVLRDPQQFAGGVKDLPMENLMLPPMPRLIVLFKGGSLSRLDNLQNALRPVLKEHVATLILAPEQIAKELAMADIDDHSSRDFYLMKYFSLTTDKKESVKKMLAELNASAKLATIPWSVSEIESGFYHTNDKDTSRTAWLLDKFSLLPANFKNAVYEKLYQAHKSDRPSKDQDVPRYGEFAFLNQNNLHATNKDRAQAIDRASRAQARAEELRAEAALNEEDVH